MDYTSWGANVVRDTRLLIRTGDEPWHEPSVQAYDNEKGLQGLLLESPQLIPGVGSIAVVDEFYIPGIGSVDVVGVEPSGEISIVECKLEANPDIRRTVVGQILAYASGMWRMSAEEFAGLFAQRAGRSLHEAVAAVAAESAIDFNPDEFTQAVSANLRDARFRLCIAVDKITDELKGIVELLNTQTQAGFEVLLLELTHAADGDISILVPQTYGLETADMKKSTTRRSESWSISDVLDGLKETCSPEGVVAARRMIDWAESRNATYYNGRGQYPTVGIYMLVNGVNRSIFAVYADPSGPTAARISLSFGAFHLNMNPDDVEALAEALERVPELEAAGKAARASDFGGYPNVPIDASLAKPGVTEALLQALDTHLGPSLP